MCCNVELWVCYGLRNSEQVVTSIGNRHSHHHQPNRLSSHSDTLTMSRPLCQGFFHELCLVILIMTLRGRDSHHSHLSGEEVGSERLFDLLRDKASQSGSHKLNLDWVENCCLYPPRCAVWALWSLTKVLAAPQTPALKLKCLFLFLFLRLVCMCVCVYIRK